MLTLGLDIDTTDPTLAAFYATGTWDTAGVTMQLPILVTDGIGSPLRPAYGEPGPTALLIQPVPESATLLLLGSGLAGLGCVGKRRQL